MTRFVAIQQAPTTWDSAGPVHESVFRSYQILLLVKDYLARGVPADVVLEIIEEMEARA